MLNILHSADFELLQKNFPAINPNFRVEISYEIFRNIAA